LSDDDTRKCTYSLSYNIRPQLHKIAVLCLKKCKQTVKANPTATFQYQIRPIYVYVTELKKIWKEKGKKLMTIYLKPSLSLSSIWIFQ